MFAVIKAGGKQYRVAPEDVIRIDRVNGEPGQVIEFDEVLMLGGETPQVGAPTVADATVAGELLQHSRGDKVIAFKKRRRKNSRRKRGYRHEFSVIRITEILTKGAKPASKPPPRPRRAAKKPEPAPEAEAAAGEAGEKKVAMKGQRTQETGREKSGRGRSAAKGKATKGKKK